MLFKFWKRRLGSVEWFEISEEELQDDIYRENKQTIRFIKRMLEGDMPVCIDHEYKLEANDPLRQKRFGND